MARLSPAPIGSWYHAVQRGRLEDRAPTKVAARTAALPPFDPNTADPGDGTAALRAFIETFDGTAPPRDSPAWEAHLDEAFARGIAHLRDLGVEFTAYPRQRVAQITGGDHPFTQLVNALGSKNIAVCFMPGHTEGKFAAGIVHRGPGKPVLLIGSRLLLLLDPHSPILVHERVHLEGEKRVGASPDGARFRAEPGSLLPGAPHWEYSTFQAADEPQAYLAGIIKALDLLRKTSNRTEATERFAEARTDVVGGTETALRKIATAKQAIGALRRGALTQLAGATLDAGEVGFEVPRRKGNYEVTFRDGGLEEGPAMRAQLLEHFAWQLRAGQEELAIFRVLGQALELAASLPALDLGIIDAAIVVATQERAVLASAAAPMAYDEVLRVFNEHAGAPTP